MWFVAGLCVKISLGQRIYIWDIYLNLESDDIAVFEMKISVLKSEWTDFHTVKQLYIVRNVYHLNFQMQIKHVIKSTQC